MSATLKDLISENRVVEINGRHFISIGRPGFNLPANNRNGYSTAKAAEAASLRCQRS